MGDILKIGMCVLRDRRGKASVEYAVIAGVLVIAIAAAFNALGTTFKAFLTNLPF